MRRGNLAPSLHDDEQRLIEETIRPRYAPPRRRVPSHSSLEPYEDPASGLDRVSSYNSLQALNRRRERERRVRLTSESAAQPRQASSVDPSLSSRYESLDYEIVENELYRAEETNNKDHQKTLYKTSVSRWIVCAIIGILTAVVGAFIDIACYFSSHVKYHIIINSLVDTCESSHITNGGCMWIVLTAWTLYNCCLVAIASFLVLYISAPAAGSGIPLIKSFLNGIHIPDVATLRTLLAKSVGVACSVAGGLAVGKEGPMIHSGAAVAALVSEGRVGRRKLAFFEHFRNDREKRDFVSAGAAAGVSAAFAAPIGGVLFSLEEGASFWNQTLTWRMVFTAMTCTFTLNLFLSFFYGFPGHLSWNGLANFGVFQNGSYNFWEVPIFALIGVLGGLTGALFNALNGSLSKLRKK